MALFSNIKFESAHATILAKVRANRGGEWSTTADGIAELRDLLLELQSWRCVYCQAPIERHANGYRELDHILPKSPSRSAALPKAHSENSADRKVTFGYGSFTFEPLNLVVACKECNNQKGTFDALKNRARARTTYPTQDEFLWFHPHYHTYKKHIRLNEDFTFTRESDEGENVINECGLASIEGLERRFLTQAKSIVGRTKSDGLKDSVRALALGVVQKNYGVMQASSALMDQWTLSRPESIAIINAWKAYFENDEDARLLQKAKDVLQVAAGKLGRSIS